ARMRERPIQDLLWALNSAGIHAFSEKGNGCPPVVIEANGSWSGTGATVRGDVSSQFVSALLMIGPFVALFHPAMSWLIKLDGPLVSKPYVEMTKAMMLAWNANWREDDGVFIFQDCDSVANYGMHEPFAIEPDASAASYFWGAAAVSGGEVG